MTLPPESIDSALLARLLRPLRAPGVISPVLVRRIVGWVDYFSGRLPLARSVALRQGLAGGLRLDALPIVHARWAAPERDDAARGSTLDAPSPRVSARARPAPEADGARAPLVAEPSRAGLPTAKASSQGQVAAPPAGRYPVVEAKAAGPSVGAGGPAPSAERGAGGPAPNSERGTSTAVVSALSPAKPASGVTSGLASELPSTLPLGAPLAHPFEPPSAPLSTALGPAGPLGAGGRSLALEPLPVVAPLVPAGALLREAFPLEGVAAGTRREESGPGATTAARVEASRPASAGAHATSSGLVLVRVGAREPAPDVGGRAGEARAVMAPVARAAPTPTDALPVASGGRAMPPVLPFPAPGASAERRDAPLRHVRAAAPPEADDPRPASAATEATPVATVTRVVMGPAAPPAPPAVAGLDVDALVEKVQRKLLRRLAAERERKGGLR
jgi:hypothetical protein